MNISKLAILLIAFALSGCVIPSQERAKITNDLRANCAAKGMDFVLDETKESGIPNITPYEMQMSGRCVPRNSPAQQAPATTPPSTAKP